MTIWKMVIITLLAAVLLGCLLGVLVGKHSLRKQRADYKPLLSKKERIIYSVCVAVGVICITIGVLYKPAAKTPDGMEGLPDENAVMDDGMNGQGAPNGNDGAVYYGGTGEVAIAEAVPIG